MGIEHIKQIQTECLMTSNTSEKAQEKISPNDVKPKRIKYANRLIRYKS